MKKIVYDNLTNEVNKFLGNIFGLRAEPAIDFAFYPDADEDEPDITYSLLVTEKTDETFRRFVKIAFDCDFDNIFVLSLLHEVGHAMTDEDWTTRQQADFANRKNGLNPDNEVDLYNYYYTPDEYAATAWAIDFINDNRQYIDRLTAIFENEIFKIYSDFVD